MSCPLLDKLAPELRKRIYEYVLTFDATVCHVTRMRPFFDKDLAENGIAWSRLAMLSTDSAVTDGTGPFTSQPAVNASILVANKQIYTEAIAVFYNLNTIRFEPQLSWLQNIMSTRPTDLALARHVVCKVDKLPETQGENGGNSGENLATITVRSLPKIFPQLRSGTVYLLTHKSREPALELCCMNKFFRQHDSFIDCKFDDVGSVVAHSRHHYGLRLVVRCYANANHWAEYVNHRLRDRSNDLEILREVREYAAASPHAPDVKYMTTALTKTINEYVTNSIPQLGLSGIVVEPLSLEFWTIVEHIWILDG